MTWKIFIGGVRCEKKKKKNLIWSLLGRWGDQVCLIGVPLFGSDTG